MMLDGITGTAADCISLSGLAGLVLAQIGIQGDSHLADATGVTNTPGKSFTDAVNIASDLIVNSAKWKLVYLTPPDYCQNDGEGFLRVTVSLGETAWTVAPYFPHMASAPSGLGIDAAAMWQNDKQVYNNRLFYRVLYNTVTSIQGANRSTLFGQQLWVPDIPNQLCSNPGSQYIAVPLPAIIPPGQ